MVDSQDNARPVRVAVADRSLPFCQAVQALLTTEPGLEFAGCAGTVPGVIELLAGEQPSVLLIDTKLAGGQDGPLIRTLRTSFPEVGLLLTGLYAGATLARRTAEGAGSGYVSKDSPPEEIAARIRSAYSDSDPAATLRSQAGH